MVILPPLVGFLSISDNDEGIFHVMYIYIYFKYGLFFMYYFFILFIIVRNLIFVRNLFRASRWCDSHFSVTYWKSSLFNLQDYDVGLQNSGWNLFSVHVCIHTQF